ncbi:MULTISPECIES: hypothetical protein [Bradyrhizobium]|uniref:Uncharacterized protein n=1 Tax=Bradyrhizobium diazoefficiens TaxID=1355477 RepID=A0A810B8U0_9BRAD|nr:hypothetical protein [Bradyrhizobium diazoefficiens]MBP1058892.1 hypothetical protein [Bradyrhizobium japonicum]QJS40745.1 hypothetical protein DI395_45690 [Bradyrhizobium diazoefficiens]WLA72294.1 hypothetical protein QIH77_36260 [Bradyrhizobium diazoefficiens]WLB40485.1 hypothetical protein QIH78_12110 [Bradyrhizobium diazoefficiens]WLC14537.1 hypothetical protein QIH76_30920 [Bradyrhizobium diazoefficiens]
MGEVVRLVTRAERERARLIREARGICDAVFPPTDPDGKQPVRPRVDHPGGDAKPEQVEGVLVT